jgi:predicted DCC family thiol-disulfide oxidoreductase YuxK
MIAAMRDRNVHEPSAGEEPHLLLYDGTCGLCHGLVQFVLARDRRGAIHYAALEGAVAARVLAPFGGRPAELDTFYLLAGYRGAAPRLVTKAQAALALARALGGPWRALAGATAVLPAAWLDGAYDFVARHRYRWFGRRAACVRPRPEQAARFLDVGEPE